MKHVVTWSRNLLLAISMVAVAVASMLAAYSIPWPAALEIYDRLQPVLTLHTQVIFRTSDSVTLRLTGERHYNRDCTSRGIFAFSKMNGVLSYVNIVRTQIKSTNESEPPGVYDFGVWMLWPVEGVGAVVVYVRYDCGGRDVFVQSEDIKL